MGKRIVFVVTRGSRSMDLYSRKLAEHLKVPKLYTDIYERAARKFNLPLLSHEALKVALYDASFVLALKNRDSFIFHFPNQHLGRYAFFLGKPFIITVHDIIRYFDLKGYGLYIQRLNLRDRIYLELDYRGVKKALKIIAVSNTTKNDLIKYLGVPEKNIAVVYEGVDHNVFKPINHRLVDDPYILFVGSEQPRKNLKGLLKAFAILKRRGFNDLKLVKVGSPGNEMFRIETLKIVKGLGLEENVIFTGYVPESELPFYYSGAVCFVFPSLYEGFGLPVLEAMACGCPAIISKIPSLMEVAGDAALKVNPLDVEELADALQEVLTNRELRGELKVKGLQRARMFSWDKTAKETLRVYREVEELIGS